VSDLRMHTSLTLPSIILLLSQFESTLDIVLKGQQGALLQGQEEVRLGQMSITTIAAIAQRGNCSSDLI
jgi:hypothetical protein